MYLQQAMTLAQRQLDEGDVARISHKTAAALRSENDDENDLQIRRLTTIASSLRAKLEAQKEFEEKAGMSEDDAYDHLVSGYFR